MHLRVIVSNLVYNIILLPLYSNNTKTASKFPINNLEKRREKIRANCNIFQVVRGNLTFELLQIVQIAIAIDFNFARFRLHAFISLSCTPCEWLSLFCRANVEQATRLKQTL